MTTTAPATIASTATPALSATMGSARCLPDDLAEILKRMRMPYLRAVALEVLATAEAHGGGPPSY